MLSLAGQLNGLPPGPSRDTGKPYDEGVIMQSAMAFAVKSFFSNTGPSGRRAMAFLEDKLRAEVSSGLPPDVVRRSEAHADFTLRGLVADLAERGLKADYRTIWTFVHAEGLSFKKNRARRRAAKAGRRQPARLVEELTGRSMVRASGSMSNRSSFPAWPPAMW